MSDGDDAPPRFCWADLATADATAATRFYGALFGWHHEDVPVEGAGTYTMLRLGERDVAALYETDADDESPAHWNAYVCVADADAAAGAAQELGATLVAAPFDVADAGRMAVVRDPAGAVVSLWQPRRHAGAAAAGEPGAFAGAELATPAAAAAERFYRALFGWSAVADPDGRVVFEARGRRVAGLYDLAAAGVDDVPPHWIVHFAVDDCDVAAARVRSLGGGVLVEPSDTPAGRVATVHDPHGASFAIVAAIAA